MVEKETKEEECCDVRQLFEIKILISINKVVLEHNPFISLLFMAAFVL